MIYLGALCFCIGMFLGQLLPLALPAEEPAAQAAFSTSAETAQPAQEPEGENLFALPRQTGTEPPAETPGPSSASAENGDDFVLEVLSGAAETRTKGRILIYHTHTYEAYEQQTDAPYEETTKWRTADERFNMVRVGDELAAELSSYGISVVHDRTLHDGESYNDAYENSLASIQSYLAKYPSIVYVLDLHRDAVQDANGTQYKLVTAEDPAAAQVSLIMGVAHDGWQDNLRLAIAVQEKLETQSPTLMRPITLLNYRYNQFAAPGSLLVEVGAAGNSLDEALRAARLFAKGFAETILGR